MTGRVGSAAPTFVTGPTTRRALSSVGAKAATVGRTVHLPSTPTTSARSLGMLAHELSHTTEHASRAAAPTPRFFGGIGERVSGALDRGEQLAHSAGSTIEGQASRLAGGGESLLRQLGSNVSDLPTGGPALGAGAAAQQIRAAAQEAVEQFAGQLAGNSGLPGSLSTMPTGLAETGLEQGASRLGGLIDGGLDAAGSAVSSVGGSANDLIAGATDAGSGLASDAAGLAEGLGGAAEVGRALGAATDHHSQLSDLLEELTERLLTEIERRGGRYAGMF